MSVNVFRDIFRLNQQKLVKNVNIIKENASSLVKMNQLMNREYVINVIRHVQNVLNQELAAAWNVKISYILIMGIVQKNVLKVNSSKMEFVLPAMLSALIAPVPLIISVLSVLKQKK
jgi:hypothetical protein